MLDFSPKAPDGHIFLEAFSPVYRHARDFLIAIAMVRLRLYNSETKPGTLVHMCIVLHPTAASLPTSAHSRVSSYTILPLCSRLCRASGQLMCTCVIGRSMMFLAVSVQTKDIVEYLKRLSKTSIPDGVVQFIKVSHGMLLSLIHI